MPLFGARLVQEGCRLHFLADHAWFTAGEQEPYLTLLDILCARHACKFSHWQAASVTLSLVKPEVTASVYQHINGAGWRNIQVVDDLTNYGEETSNAWRYPGNH